MTPIVKTPVKCVPNCRANVGNCRSNCRVRSRRMDRIGTPERGIAGESVAQIAPAFTVICRGLPGQPGKYGRLLPASAPAESPTRYNRAPPIRGLRARPRGRSNPGSHLAAGDAMSLGTGPSVTGVPLGGQGICRRRGTGCGRARRGGRRHRRSRGRTACPRRS